MKTSNILLLSLLGFIILSITAILFIIGKDVKGSDFLTYEKAGNYEQKRTLPAFNKLDVDSKFNVQYTQDTFQNFMIKADSNLISSISAEVKEGKLYLHCSKNLRKRQQIDVFITNDSINEVGLNAGSIFKTSRSMKVNQFAASGKAGAIVDIDGTFNKLSVAAEAGCVSNLSGKCQFIEINSDAGGVINAANLNAANGKINSTTGAVTTLNVTGELSVEASTGAIIKCQGNPKVKDLNVSTGAQFIR
jgi:hypothetical protein